jgi:hypothetical protein
MISYGVIASSTSFHNYSSIGSAGYSGGVVSGSAPVVAANSPSAPTVQNLTVGVQFGVGNVATWDPTVNPPGTIYNVFVYDPATATTTQYTNTLGIGLVSVPPGGAVAVQAVVPDVNGNTTYGPYATYIPPASLGVNLGPGGHL